MGKVEYPDTKIKQQTEDFLANAWMIPGFRHFCVYREKKIKDALAGGMGLKEVPRDDYVRMIGQRFEIRRWYFLADEAWKKKTKEKPVSGKSLRNESLRK